MDPIPADPALPPLPSPKPASHSPASTKYSVCSPTPEDTGRPRTSEPLFLSSPPPNMMSIIQPLTLVSVLQPPTLVSVLQPPTLVSVLQPPTVLSVLQPPNLNLLSIRWPPNVLSPLHIPNPMSSSSPKRCTRGCPRKQKVRKVTLLVTGPPAADPRAQESDALEEEEEDELQLEDSAVDGPPSVSPYNTKKRSFFLIFYKPHSQHLKKKDTRLSTHSRK